MSPYFSSPRNSAPIASEASSENQNEEDDDQDANHADPAMSEAVAVSAEAAAEAPDEEYDENDEKNGTNRHDVPSAGKTLLICGLTPAPKWLMASPRGGTPPVAIQDRIGYFPSIVTPSPPISMSMPL